MKKAYSFDNENYYGAYDTDKETIEGALREIDGIRKYDPDSIPGIVYIGACEFFEPSLSGSGWDIIEAAICQADDEGFSEWDDGYLSDVPKEQLGELEEGLEKVFKEWIDRYDHHAHFFKVNSYDAYLYDREKHELRKTGDRS